MIEGMDNRIFVDGGWRRRPPRTSSRWSIRPPRRSIGTVAAGTAADIDTAVGAARAAGPRLGHLDARGARGDPGRHRGRAEAARRRGGRADHRRTRRAADVVAAPARRAAADGPRSYARTRHGVPVRRGDRQLGGLVPAGRRGRRDHAVELSAAPDRHEGRCRAGRRLHRGAEAGRGHAADRIPAGRSVHRGRAAARSRSTWSPGSGPVAGQALVEPSGRGHGLVHRIHRGRPVRSAPPPAVRSSGWRWNSAASPPTSSCRAPTWPRR